MQSLGPQNQTKHWHLQHNKQIKDLVLIVVLKSHTTRPADMYHEAKQKRYTHVHSFTYNVGKVHVGLERLFMGVTYTPT